MARRRVFAWFMNDNDLPSVEIVTHSLPDWAVLAERAAAHLQFWHAAGWLTPPYAPRASRSSSPATAPRLEAVS